MPRTVGARRRSCVGLSTSDLPRCCLARQPLSFPWLEYHVVNKEGKMFCFVCKRYDRTSSFCVGSTNFNPLTPVPPVTGHDEHWPFIHFWHHHFWPKLASSILNFCRRKRSFQWCPDQSDLPNVAWDMHKKAQKVEWKTQSKISCHYTWLLHGKNCLSRWCFLRSFLTASKPSRRSITAAKRKEEEKKERRKKNSKNWKA